jgi:predicted AAA+ superfamily ATPase
VERYPDLLEQTFVIFRLPSFSTNPRKEIAESRKFFFRNTGIRNALLEVESGRPDNPSAADVFQGLASEAL